MKVTYSSFRMKIFLIRLMASIIFSSALTAHAGQESGPVSIASIRPYLSGDIYLELASVPFCSTSVYRIRADSPAKKEMYAAALAAITTGKKVRLELNNAGGCTGWGTDLQSIYLLAN